MGRRREVFARDDSIAIQSIERQKNLVDLGLGVGLPMKRTLRGSIKKAKKGSGFLKRMSTSAGQKVIKARRAKGRYKISI